MSHRYAVIGNPVEHSRSPTIHAQFARQTGIDLEYGRILAPVDGFVAAVERFRDEGGSGLNVTLPFKLDAFAWAARHSARATEAGAVNTLRFDADAGGSAWGDNTDGAGLVRDLCERNGFALAGRSVLLLGAGGAARGIVGPLLDAGVTRLVVANRSRANAERLAEKFAARAVHPVCVALDAIEPGFDLIVEASGSGLRDERVPIVDEVFEAASLAYDLYYAASPTAFVRQARGAGCRAACDGLGMLVEQAAESFLDWHGVRPQTDPVYSALREALHIGSTPQRPPSQ
ncbi:MAG: shikimate dehydrogenase [Burkholderiaceae bacterium]|nr:shikimate dehydrogenase [Burkholderiaceae bacterium]